MRTLTNIAVQRDTPAGPRKPKRKATTGGEAKETSKASLLDVLVAAIPTEPLALYTGLIAIVVAQIGIGEDARMPLRWALYAAGIAVILLWLPMAYFRDRGESRQRKFPWAETAAAAIAFAAWGLVTPQSPLSGELSGDDLVIWTAIIATAGVVLLGFLGRPLTQSVNNGN
jgi:hypothetical protein